MKILKSILSYFLNIFSIIAISFLCLIIAIFAPKHLSEVIIETDKEIKKTKKKKK